MVSCYGELQGPYEEVDKEAGGKLDVEKKGEKERRIQL